MYKEDLEKQQKTRRKQGILETYSLQSKLYADIQFNVEGDGC